MCVKNINQSTSLEQKISENFDKGWRKNHVICVKEGRFIKWCYDSPHRVKNRISLEWWLHSSKWNHKWSEWELKSFVYDSASSCDINNVPHKWFKSKKKEWIFVSLYISFANKILFSLSSDHSSCIVLGFEEHLQLLVWVSFQSARMIPFCFQISLIFKIGNFIHCSSNQGFSNS
jgi:hypothetical protein